MLLVVALLIILVWAICASVMAGMGSLVLQKLCADWNISDAFWIGLCAAVSVLQLYHFFRPIDNLIAVLLCSLGVLGVVLNRNAFVRLIGRVSGPGLWSVFGCVAAVLVIAVRCAGPVFHYDTGFYGAMAVRWFVTYPLVPGLTNLLGQLGLNSNLFLCEAALQQGPLRDLAFHLLVGLFLCALVVPIVQSCVRVLGGHQENVDYFILPLAVPTIVWILNAEVVGTNTDLPTSVISLVGLIAPIRCTPRESETWRENRAPRIALHCRDFFVCARRYVQDNCIGSRSAWLEPGASSRCITRHLLGTKKDTHTCFDRPVLRSRDSLVTSRRRPQWVSFLP